MTDRKHSMQATVSTDGEPIALTYCCPRYGSSLAVIRR